MSLALGLAVFTLSPTHSRTQDNFEFNESSLAMVALEVLKVVNHCHEIGLLHGDVKPAK